MKFNNDNSENECSKTTRYHHIHLISFQKLTKEDACAEVGLMDENLLRRCIRFYSKAAQWLLKLATNDTEIERLVSILTDTCSHFYVTNGKLIKLRFLISSKSLASTQRGDARSNKSLRNFSVNSDWLHFPASLQH